MHNTTSLPNFHVLIVKTIAETNANASRVRIISERFQQSIVIPFDNEGESNSPTLETAEAWLIKQGHNVIGHAEGKKHYYVICDHVDNCFKPLK